jgi:carnitine-CoA ligase
MCEGERTLSALLAARAAERPEDEIVRFESTAVSYRALDESASRFANALHELGLRKGDRGAVMLGNRQEHLTSWFGMVRAGVIEVPLNTSLRGDLLAYMLRLTDCRLLVIDAQWLDRVEAILPDLPSLQWLVVVGGEVAVAGVAARPFAELLEASADPPAVDVAPWDPSVILFSSGTTGPSKGVVLTHNANIRAALNVCEMMEYREDDRLFNAFPLFHVNARYTGVVAAMLLERGALVRTPFRSQADRGLRLDRACLVYPEHA